MRRAVLFALLAWCGLQADAAVAQHALTKQDVETYLDGLLPYALQRGDVAGAVVVVVKDGEILLQKGYGVADVQSGKLVDPNTTLFRPGSVSKAFTATAVMQLVEAGRLDLDRDINEYLDFRIPSTFAKPITLRNLLSHTAGFEDVYKNVLLTRAQLTPSTETYVKGALPPRIFPPGTTVAYSNYGAALAGYIVQRVAGEPYEAYVARHIFAPLGMEHSTFTQPVPASLALAAPQGYLTASKSATPFEFIATVPAGALSSTGTDMAKFMLMHLGNGQLGSAQILNSEVASQMHAPAFRPLAGLQALSLGFYGEDRNGHRIIGHAGDLISFHADLHLLLDDNVGLFIALNSLGKEVTSSAIRTALFRGFVDRYFPAEVPLQPTLATAMEHGRRIAGRYQASRRAQSTFVSLGNLLTQGELAVHPDATIEFSPLTALNGEPKLWREVAPYRWRELHGTAQLAAAFDGKDVRFLFTDDAPPVAVWQPVPPLYLTTWNLPLLVMAVTILMATVLVWPINALVRRHFHRPSALPPNELRLSQLVRIVALLDLLLLGAWLAFLLAANRNLALLSEASDSFLRFLQLLGIASLLGLVPVLLQLVRAWRRPGQGWWSRLSISVIAVACLATAWFTLAFHLLRASLAY